jgi:hypothetical protein
MSSYYKLIDAEDGAIPDELLLDGRLKKYGIEAETVEGPLNKVTLLSGVDGHLCAIQDASGFCSEFVSFSGCPWSILAAIEKEFNATIVDEDDPRFWDETEQERIERLLAYPD